jgi:hypothetical protein
MNQFSASDAALEGFRITRNHPRAILAWCGVYFLGILLIALVMAAVLGPTFLKFMSDREIEPSSYDQFAGELLKFWPSIIVVIAIALFFISAITNAMFRTMFRLEEVKNFGLKFGADEVRVAVVHLALSGLFLCLAFAFGQFVTAAFQFQPATMGLSLVAGALLLWVFVRLGLALPATFIERRVAFAHGWRLSRGRFWPLLGMWVLAAIFYLMMWVIVAVVSGAFVAGTALVQSNLSGVALAVLVIAAALVSMLIQLFSSVMQIVIPLAPTAIAYQALNGPQAQAPAPPPTAAEPATS